MNKFTTKFLWLLFLPVVAFWHQSCNNARFLAEDESLYVGSKIDLQDTVLDKRTKAELKESLRLALRPYPNSTFLGMRLKLTAYNMVGHTDSAEELANVITDQLKDDQISLWGILQSVGHYVGNKYGEAPVRAEDVNTTQNQQILANMLENQGFFNPEITIDKYTTRKRKTTFTYKIQTGYQKKIREITYPDDDTSQLVQDVYALRENSLLKPGDAYNLNTILAERLRINNILKNKGYYFFNPSYILARVDTGIGNNQLDMHLVMQYDIMRSNVYDKYTIRNVTINSNFKLNTSITDTSSGRQRTAKASDTTMLQLDSDKVVYIVDPSKAYRPRVFLESVKLKPGAVYSLDDQNITLNRLVSLNSFKFVKNEFSLVREDSLHDYLDANYLLTPYPRKSFSFEVNGYSQNDSRLGSRVSITWKTRNLFKGAEQFSTKVTGGFEVQYGGVAKLPNIYSFGWENSLVFPRSVLPKFLKYRPSSFYVPKTMLTASYNYLTWENLYRMHSFSLGWGYNWKETVDKEHKLFPINITFVRTDTLDRENIDQLNYSNLLFRGVIIGPTYEYTYNSQLNGTRINNFYFDGLLDLSGNLLGLAYRTSLDKDPKRIFGSQFAQYVKVQADGRYYRLTGLKSMFVARLFAGFGYAYGNSFQLPNIKQFFAGGASSLRGFRSRLLGPGTFNNYDANGDYKYVQLLGDAKLEANAEYRFPIYGEYFKGAAFLDAGNIWLLRDNPDFPGGKLTGDFYKQIAVSAGVGLRMDFSVVVVRFDFGIPLRKPWETEDGGWVISQIKPLSHVWRDNNIVFNLAIGYPF